MKIRRITGERTRWRVWSESRPALAFIVDSEYQEEPGQPAGWACGCEQFLFRGEVCKHIEAVKRMSAGAGAGL